MDVAEATACERCGRDVTSTPHLAMCGHPLTPITVDELAEIRDTYERGETAALGFSVVARLLNEIDRLADVLSGYVERDSADAAAGSYAGRAEKAEAERNEARAEVARWSRSAGLLATGQLLGKNAFEVIATLTEERDEARAQLKRAETERDEWIDSFDLMRAESDARGARLVEIGAGHEWAIRCQLNGIDYYEGPYDDEQQARESGNFFNPGWRLVARPVGGWREVEEGGERG